MKRAILITCIAWLFLLGQPGALFADYVMMCTFFAVGETRVFKVSDEGNISFDYELKLTTYNEPFQLKFSPDGRWGLIGCGTSLSNPETQFATVIGVDENRHISVLGTVHNKYDELVAINPVSQYGVYGNTLQTLRFYPDNSYCEIQTDNSYLANSYADFSELNFNITAMRTLRKIAEYTLLPDGRTTSTGVMLDISPSSGNEDLEISPDGKTCIILSIGTYRITVLRVNEEGGFTLVQQFNSPSGNAKEVDFTPDSKFAVVSFEDRQEDGNLRIYQIGIDSQLTLVDAIDLPGIPGEDMAVTPDGKFAITRELIGSKSYFYVVRIHEDGTLEYLPEKDYICSGHVSAIAFVPPRITAAGQSWTMY